MERNKTKRLKEGKIFMVARQKVQQNRVVTSLWIKKWELKGGAFGRCFWQDLTC